MPIEIDILEIKEKLIELEELLRKAVGVHTASNDDDSEFDKTSAADYCGVTRGTVARYAKEIGFPEHRHTGKKNVYYLKSELDTIIRIKRLQKKIKR